MDGQDSIIDTFPSGFTIPAVCCYCGKMTLVHGHFGSVERAGFIKKQGICLFIPHLAPSLLFHDVHIIIRKEVACSVSVLHLFK